MKILMMLLLAGMLSSCRSRDEKVHTNTTIVCLHGYSYIVSDSYKKGYMAPLFVDDKPVRCSNGTDD